MATARSRPPIPGSPTEPDGSAARTRASAMPAEERRAAILAATVPLLIAHGTEITTREIAAAACVAEGTIFRVFADKETLIEAAVEQAFDPAPLEAEFRAIDPALPLDVRCEAAVEILQHRLASLWRLLTAVGMSKPPEGQRSKGERPSIVPALSTVFEPDRARLRMDPMDAADVLRSLTLASSHPGLTLGEPRTAHEIVSVVLDGVRSRPGGEHPC